MFIKKWREAAVRTISDPKRNMLCTVLICLLSGLSSAAAEPVTLQLKWKHQFQFAGFYMAAEKGFYHDAGFDVEIRAGEVGKIPVDELLNGHADYVVADPGVLLARARGAPVRIVAAIFQHSPLALIVTKESDIRNFSDLRGKRIMLVPGLNADIDAALGAAGVSADDFTRQDTSFDIRDLVNGKTDAFAGYITDQPHQLALMGVPYRILHPNQQGINFYGDILVTTEEKIQQQPEKVRAFTQASIRGWQYALAHVDETIAVIQSKFNSQNLSLKQLEFEAQKTIEMIESDVVQVGYMREQRWYDIADIYIAQGLLPAGFSAAEAIYQPKESFADMVKRHGWAFGITVLIVILLALILHAISLRRAVKSRTAELERIRHQQNLILNSAGEGIYGLDTRGNSTFVNKAAAGMLGYPADELIGKPMHNQVHHSHPDGSAFPRELCPMYAAFTDGKIHTATDEVLWRKDGSSFPVEYTSTPIYEEGLLTGAVVTFSDITKRKQAETNLRIAATAFDSQDSLMITDAAGVILRVNQAFCDTSGYTVEEAVGQTPKILKSGRHDAAFYARMWESIHRTGSWQGEVWDRKKNGEIYPKWLSISAVKGADGKVSHYVGSHIDISERKAAEEAIENLAFYDPLTGLPNRRLLHDRLSQAIVSSTRSGRQGALLFIDLDNFKTLNDTLGHDVGDILLQQVAERLILCVREVDTVARLGGDEFVVLLEELSHHPMRAGAQTEVIGEKIISNLGRPYLLDSHECLSTPSIGAALFGNNQVAGELLKQADIAMYQAKKGGRNALRFFDPEMQEIVKNRANMENELRGAIEKQQFQLYYQIQVDSSHQPRGAEVLIRWLHPERGPVSPAQFIPMAEETGLILPIGQWVLNTACAQIKTWEQGALTRNLALAVNVSAKQFHQADFVDQVRETVQRHGINPGLLKLELTESMLQSDIEDTIASMHALKKIGIQFSLDDFGTGYSSLQYLKRLPLDQLKIDQSFVRDIVNDSSDKAIVGTIIAMAHNMNLGVIAEGVETEEQLQSLKSSCCTHYQGYLFGKPVPIAQFEAQLKRG